MSQSTRETVTWNKVYDYVRAVKEWADGQTFTGVYGLPRGGCTLAVMLSHILGLPYLAYPKHGCLIVDDISDTGGTLKFYKLQGYKTTTMYYHASTTAMPDFTMYEKTNKWIHFPWEMER